MAQDVGDGCLGVVAIIASIAITTAGFAGIGSKADRAGGGAVFGAIGVIIGVGLFWLGIHLIRRK